MKLTHGRFWLVTSICLVWGLSMAGQEAKLPEGKGKETLESTCTECHGLDKIIDEGRTKGQWESVVNKMRLGGATMTDAEFTNLIDYLTAHFGPEEAAKKVNANKASAKEIETELALTASEAAAIVRYREAHGAFKAWLDLTKADGVDKAKIEAKKDRLSF